MLDQTIDDLAGVSGTRAACAALGRSRATYYRRIVEARLRHGRGWDQHRSRVP
jgi:hypothetical protein